MLSWRAMNSRYVPTSFATYHDHLVVVLMCSPDRFTSFDGSPVNQQVALREAFEVLQEAFPLVGKKLKDDYLSAILRELLQMAYEFFSAGDDRNGIYALQEVEGSVWPSRKIPPRHAPAAERRAHGKVDRFAGVIPNPYPYRGRLEDMGPSQLRLFQSVMSAYDSGDDSLDPGKVHHWLLDTDSVARRINERSRKAAAARIMQELSTRNSLAALRAENVYGSLLVFDVEEPGRARMSVRGEPGAFKMGTPNFIVAGPIWVGASVA